MNRITPIEDLVKKATDEIQTISTEKAAEKINNEEYLFIDIRDIRELWREGKIQNAYHAPRGMLEFWFDPGSPYFKEKLAYGKKFILYCASGWRSALATKTLQDMNVQNIMSLNGGFSLWGKNGLPTEKVIKK